MIRIPALEYSLSHPHPKGHLFLIATLAIFLLTLPVLVLVNLATQGSELVPSLQSHFLPNETLLEGWWGTSRLPALLRPKVPGCEPKDLGRGDIFRLSASLFDYTVMSTWNTSEGTKASGVQEQRRAEYRGQSFDSCYVNTARFDYSLPDQTDSVTVGVLCPGTDEYPIEVSMQTTVTFAWELSKDFIGQYYGPGLDLMNLTDTDPSDYRKVVLAVLEVISTDSLTIFRGRHLSNPALSMRVAFSVDPDTAAYTDTASTLTYLNGTQPAAWPREAGIYFTSISNLVAVVIHSVNLDLGSHRSPNLFRNASLLSTSVRPNRAPNGTDPADWAQQSQTFYYGQIQNPYQSWAETLLHGQPVEVGSLTGLPNESVMLTTYLCPTYQIKPLNSLLSSVFIGSATMTLSVWGIWMFFTAFVAKRIMAPRVQCQCEDCDARRKKLAERQARKKDAKPVMSRMISALTGLVKHTKPTTTSADVEQANPEPQEHGKISPPGLLKDSKYESYTSGSTIMEEKRN